MEARSSRKRAREAEVAGEPGAGPAAVEGAELLPATAATAAATAPAASPLAQRGAARPQKSSTRPDVAEAHTVKHLHQMRRQHMANLLAMMRQYAQQRNVARLAQVTALLLAAQSSSKLKSAGTEGQRQESEVQARLAEVLATGYAAIRDGPWPPGITPTPDQLKRLLRQAHAYQPTPEGKDGVALELALLMLSQGDLSEAYDALSAMPARGDAGPLEFDKALLKGLIRHVQWAQAMQRSETRRGGGSAGPLGFDAMSYNPSQWARAGRVAKELFQEAGEHLQRAYRLRPACTELAYLLVQRALVTENGLPAAALLAQRHREAAPADVDAHALYALLLVMGAGRAVTDAGAAVHADPAEDLLGCFEAMLRCDPGNDVAMAAVLEMEESGVLPATSLLRLLCAYLDGVAPSLNPRPLQLQAWKTLAACVGTAAEQLLSAHSAVQQTQRKLRLHLTTQLRPVPAQRVQPDADMEQQQQEQQQPEQEQEQERGLGQPPSPSQHPQQQQQQQHPETRAAAGADLEASQEPSRGPRQRQGMLQPGGSGPPREAGGAGEQELPEGGRQGGSSIGEGQRLWHAAVGEQEEEANGGELEAAEADWLYQELGPQQRELVEALARWREVAAALEGCLWWQQHHFVPPQPGSAVLALRTGRASAAALEAMGVVGAAVHGLWVEERLRAVSSCGARLPRSMRSVFVRGAMRVLRQHGAVEEADRVRAAFKAITESLRVARGEQRRPRFAVLGVLAHHARHRTDFWRAARKPWTPPKSWLSIPLGLTHPRLGPVADLPPGWWRSFPQARRGSSGGSSDGGGGGED